MNAPPEPAYRVAVIGGGPAGLMAAEVMARAGLSVTVFDRMPSLGRKLLMAGRGGLNITHAEDGRKFLARYGAAAAWMAPHLAEFSPEMLRDWCAGLGQPTFIGSSGRVFPTAMKASPLLPGHQKFPPKRGHALEQRDREATRRHGLGRHQPGRAAADDRDSRCCGVFHIHRALMHLRRGQGNRPQQVNHAHWRLDIVLSHG